MVDLQLFLIGGNGDTIPFDDSEGFVLASGLRGTGIAPTSVRIDNSAGDGGTWRSTRRTIREFDLPVVVSGDTRDEVEERLRRFAAAISDRVGTPRLRAVYSDGTGPFDIEIHYTGGAETQWGSDASSTFCRWVITAQAPDPYWTSVDSESLFLGADPDTRGLLPRLVNLPVKSSQVIGDFTLDNAGDVDAYPTWTFRGPMDSVTVTNAAGLSFTYVDAIAENETITIDTLKGTVIDGTGANKYGSLGSSPKLFSIAPGRSILNVEAQGTSPGIAGVGATLITCSYKPRREVIH